MNKYLRSIGFSQIKTEEQVLTLLNKLENDYKNNFPITEEMINKRVEIKVYVDNNIGLLIYGKVDKDLNFMRMGYYPFIESFDSSTKSKIQIQRQTALDEYLAIIDDIKSGISVIFKLINVSEYLILKNEKQKIKNEDIYLAGFCKNAKVLLPLYKNEKQKEKIKISTIQRDKLIEAAKQGDESAIETLSFEDMQTYNLVTRRLETEDVYSVVDSIFIPHGLECDLYQVVGDIQDIKTLNNIITNEVIYDVTLLCNDILLHVGVNERDLLGELEIGRRFKGEVWLLGKVDFIRESIS